MTVNYNEEMHAMITKDSKNKAHIVEINDFYRNQKEDIFNLRVGSEVVTDLAYTALLLTRGRSVTSQTQW